MTPNDIEVLRRAWRLVESKNAYVLTCDGMPLIEYSEPGQVNEKGESIPPTATVRVFTDFEDGFRYREDIIQAASVDSAGTDISLSALEISFKLVGAGLNEVPVDELQEYLNENDHSYFLQVALSRMRATDEKPVTIDILFSENILDN